MYGKTLLKETVFMAPIETILYNVPSPVGIELLQISVVRLINYRAMERFIRFLPIDTEVIWIDYTP